jgi:hypothetical protein
MPDHLRTRGFDLHFHRPLDFLAELTVLFEEA